MNASPDVPGCFSWLSVSLLYIKAENNTHKNRSLWNIERILIRWMLFRLPQRPQNDKTILAITELLDQLLKQILMVHPTVIAVFYNDNELRHSCFWPFPTSWNSNFLFIFQYFFFSSSVFFSVITKITVLIPRLCLSPKDSWCTSVEAAWPEEHLQGRKSFWTLLEGNSKRLLKWVHVRPLCGKGATLKGEIYVQIFHTRHSAISSLQAAAFPPQKKLKNMLQHWPYLSCSIIWVFGVQVLR